jgi:protein Shroom
LKRRQSYSEFEDLIEKKRELRERMLSKIMFLREERDLLMEEKAENDILGKTIAHNLEGVARNSELDKYRQFLEEIEQITKLTVSLTIRLSRLSKKLGTTAGSFTKVETVSIP